MIARLDHHPMLTAALALTTAVLGVVVIALATLLITSTPAVSPTSIGGGHTGAGAANPAGRMDAGGKGYGMPIEAPAERVDAGGKGYGMPVEKPAQTGNGAGSAVDRHAEVVAAYHNSR